MIARASPAWSLTYRAFYRLIRAADPLARAWWRRFGLANVVELRLRGRRTGRERSILLGLLIAEGRWYLGHPNGAVAWTLNLDASDGQATLVRPGLPPLAVVAYPLPPGPERERAILATWQHPFPGNLLYRLGRRHILAVGRFYRVAPSALTE